MKNIVDVSKIHVKSCDIWTTLCTLACFGKSTTPSQHTSLRTDSASIQITSKIISEQNGLLKSVTRNAGKRFRKLEGVESQCFPCLSNRYEGRGYGLMSNRTGPCGMLRHSFKTHVCIFIAHNPKWHIHILYLITSTILKNIMIPGIM